MDEGKIITDLKRDEGFRSHAYQDHLGYWTIGIGRMIDKRKGGGISKEEADYLLLNDIWRVLDQLRDNLPWFDQLSESQQRALVNMGFQLGVGGVLKFRRMLAHLKSGNGEAARQEALDSLWARQTPYRALRVANLLAKVAK